MAGRSNIVTPVFPHHRARIPPTMADPQWLKIIEQNPIGNGLDGFRASFRLVCKGRESLCPPGELEQLGGEGKAR